MNKSLPCSGPISLVCKVVGFNQINGSQSVIRGRAVGAVALSPGNLLEMPNLKFHFRTSESDTLGVGHRNVCFRKPSRQGEPRPFQLCSLYILNCVLHISEIMVVTIITIMMMLLLTSSHTSTARFIPQTRTLLPHPLSLWSFSQGL